MNLKPIKSNYLSAADRMTAFSQSARRAGRLIDADALELAAYGCRECAEFAAEGVGSEADGEVGAEAPAVCCLCGKEGRPVGLGWTCSNPACPRKGAQMGRATFEGEPETAQGAL